MSCDQFRTQLKETGALEIAAEALVHMNGCAGCGAFFQTQRRLEAGLKQIAAAQAGWSAPPRVEAALLRQFRSQVVLEPGSTTPVPPTPFWIRFRLPALAAAGVLAGALAMLLISRTPDPSHRFAGTTISQAAAEIDDDSALDNGFVPLPYFANSGDLANTAEADVVRVEMPRSTLVTLGVPVNDDGNSGTVQAELLLGEGGVPQAVRILE
jgi:hypothetical protein